MASLSARLSLATALLSIFVVGAFSFGEDGSIDRLVMQNVTGCAHNPNVTYCEGNGYWNGTGCICDAGYCTSNCRLPCHQLTYIGVIVSLLGNVIISVGLTFQKRAHVRSKEFETKGEKVSVLKIKELWLGIVLNALGEVGNFLGYSFAPATAVAPLGAFSLVSSTIISRLWLKEHLPVRKIVGCGLTILGSVAIVLDAPTNDIGKLNMESFCVAMFGPLCGDPCSTYNIPFVVYLALVLIGIIGLLVALCAFKRQSLMVYIFLCACFGAVTIMAVKGVSTAVRLTFSGQASSVWTGPYCPITYTMLVILATTLPLQVRFLNGALAHYDATVVIPINYVFFTLFAIMTGLILFQEYHVTHSYMYGLFGLGFLTVCSGVYLLNLQKPPKCGRLKKKKARRYTTAIDLTTPSGQEPRGGPDSALDELEATIDSPYHALPAEKPLLGYEVPQQENVALLPDRRFSEFDPSTYQEPAGDAHLNRHRDTEVGVPRLM